MWAWNPLLQLSPRNRGRTIMMLGILAVTPDSVCVRFLTESGTGPFCILTWKMFFASCLTGLYTLVACGGPRAVLASLYRACCHAAVAAPLAAMTDMGFTVALVFTSAANTLLFLSLNPLWAALLGFLVLGERMPPRTIAALLVAFCAVGLIFVPQIIQGAEAEHRGALSTWGDFIAVGSGLTLACYITVLRHAGKQVPDANMTVVAVLGSALAAVVSAAIAGREALPRAGGLNAATPLWQFWCVMLADSLCVASLFVALVVSPALISGPEVGLIMLLEVILGPFWVLLAYGDVPPLWTLAGGGLLLLTLAGHEVTALLGGSAGGKGEGPAKGAESGGPAEDAEGAVAGTDATSTGFPSSPDGAGGCRDEETGGSEDLQTCLKTAGISGRCLQRCWCLWG
uniref:EamA domain-containing protein n=1 Tax=Pyrodinium bahamense TaxID=73915 RepID=A0A7S0ALK0_9DINO